MNREELVEAIATQVEMPKATVRRVLTAFTDTVVDTVSNKDSVALTGFGSFTAKDRQSRVCRNPQTGESMTVPAKTVPSFRAGKKFKETVAEAL